MRDHRTNIPTDRRSSIQILSRSLLIGSVLQCGGHALAAVDGAWHSGPGNPSSTPSALDGQVRAILSDGGNRCYLGGGFDAPFDAIAYWDGASHRSAGVPFWIGEASANAMARFQGKVHVAGRFPTESGVAILMRLDEENGVPTWIPLIFAEGRGPNEGLALAAFEDDLWIGGEFGLPDGTENIAAWNGFSCANVGNANGPVQALANHDGRLYAGGDFTNLGAGCPAGLPGCPFEEMNLAVWNGTWSEAFGGADRPIYALHSVGAADSLAGLYVGGDFTKLGPSSGHRGIGRVETTGSSYHVDTMDGGIHGRVRTIERWSQGLAVGGTFDSAGTTPPVVAFNIATWTDAGDWEEMDLGLEGAVTDRPYGAAVLAMERYVAVDSVGLHAGGNFSSYGNSLSPCSYAAKFFEVTTYKALEPFISALDNSIWSQLDSDSYLVSSDEPGMPASLDWGVAGASFQRMQWDPASLQVDERLQFNFFNDEIPDLSIYRERGPGPFLPKSIVEIDPSANAGLGSVRINCVTASGETIESAPILTDDLIRIDVSSAIDGIDSGLLRENGTGENLIGIRVGNPADTVVVTTDLGAEVFRAQEIAQFQISFGDRTDSQSAESGRFRLQITGDLVIALDECGFGVGGDLHRLDPDASPDSFDIIDPFPLGESAVAYAFGESDQTVRIQGTALPDSVDGSSPLYSRRSMRLAAMSPGEAFGVRIEDRSEGQNEPANTLELECLPDRIDAIYRFDRPDLGGKISFLGADGEIEIPDDLVFTVFVDTSAGVTVTEDDESGATIVDWTHPGLIVFMGPAELPAIEGPGGMVIGKTEGADGDDTWDVLQRSYMQVTSTRPSELLLDRIEFTIVEGESEPETEPADLNRDGRVDGADLALILAGWGFCPGCPADLNGDDTVNGADLALVLAAWR